MIIKLIIIFIAIPIIEFYILIKLGILIGACNTILIILFTGIFGAYLVKDQGVKVIYQISEDLRQGIFPAEPIFDGLFVLIAGLLLITPGILTDITGFLCIIPFTRHFLKRIVKTYINRKLDQDGVIDIKFNTFNEKQ